jgi:hypothetical protein
MELATNHLDILGAITGFFEDGKGRIAVEFEAFPESKRHLALCFHLVRIKVIKYGRYKFES